MGSYQAKEQPSFLDKINTEQINKMLIPSNVNTSKYEGYSNYRRDQVELILSTLDNGINEKKYVDQSTYRQKQGSLVLPQITKHAQANSNVQSPSALEFISRYRSNESTLSDP